MLELSGPLDGRLDAVLAALEAHVWLGALPSPGGRARQQLSSPSAVPRGPCFGLSRWRCARRSRRGELAGVVAGLDVRPQPGGEPLVPVDRVLGGGAAPGGPATEPAG